MPIEELEEKKRYLEFELIKARKVAGGLGFKPPMSSPTKKVRDIKKNIARINSFLNQKRSIKESIERCKGKPNLRNRERRLRGKLKELKQL